MKMIAIIFILSSLIGMTLGFFLYPILFNKRKKKDKKDPVVSNVYLRRGVYKRTYTNALSKLDFDIEYELGEVAKTSTKSRVKVLTFKVISNLPVLREIYGPGTTGANMVLDPVDGAWIDTSEIDWIEGSVQESRDLKIDSILNL